MKTVNIHEAKTHLSRLAEEVAGGEEIIVAKAGRPMMKLVPIEKKPKQRKIGMLKGKMRIAKDFDAPLPDELLNAFEGRIKG
jgi:prevent-host-death family protein